MVLWADWDGLLGLCLQFLLAGGIEDILRGGIPESSEVKGGA